MGLNPVPVLMAMIIYSNVGGATTPVGDPPNVIIASNHKISKGVSIKIGIIDLIYIMKHIEAKVGESCSRGQEWMGYVR